MRKGGERGYAHTQKRAGSLGGRATGGVDIRATRGEANINIFILGSLAF